MNEHEDRPERLVLKRRALDIRQDYNFLTELLLYGELDPERYLRELKKTVAFDESGEPWAISPQNGNWYRLTEEGPALGEPPEILYVPAQGFEEEAGGGEGTAAAAAASPGAAGKPAGQKKFCTQCGSVLRENARFCRECGTAVKGQGGGA